jgi:hypothetical protein
MLAKSKFVTRGFGLEVDDLAASVAVVGKMGWYMERTSLKNAIKILQRCTETQYKTLLFAD